MYRFRKTKYLLDERYDELNNMEIYFSAPQELNDPMEGVKDVFWQGDEVLWRNFMKHYLMCLEHVTSMWNIVGEEKEINKGFIPVFKSFSEFSSVKHKERFIKIQDYFFSNKIMKNMPSFLSSDNKKIRYNELLKYMKVIHKFAFDSINFVDSNYGYNKRMSIFEDILDEDKNIILLESGNHEENKEGDKIKDKNNEFILEDEIENMFNCLNNINSNLDLFCTYDEKGEGVFSNKTFIMIQFPEAYLSRIQELIYPKWYAASFMDQCTNLSSWGTYGDNHKGVCLKFKTKYDEQKDAEFLKLTGVIKNGAYSVIGDNHYKLSKMNYEDKLYEIDFFKGLGRLSYPKFNKQWYTNEEGEISSTIDNIKFDEEWLHEYMENFNRSITTKSREYSCDGEYRIILDELFNDYSSEEDRKLKYDFNDFEAIIFGIKTSSVDKAKIINIIRRKCHETGRNNFDFYECEYCHESGKIKQVKMDISI